MIDVEIFNETSGVAKSNITSGVNIVGVRGYGVIAGFKPCVLESGVMAV